MTDDKYDTMRTLSPQSSCTFLTLSMKSDPFLTHFWFSPVCISSFRREKYKSENTYLYSLLLDEKWAMK